MLRRQFLTRIALAASTAIARPVCGDPRTAKLVEWGWGTPSPTYIRDHSQAMEQLPFDGLILDPTVNGGSSDNTGKFGWQAWGHTRLREEDYSQSIDALQHIPWQRFTENFLRFNVTPGQLDWYDKGFQVVLANATLAARLAQQAGLRGLLFDVEQYHGKLFHYPSQPSKSAHDFAAYQAQVRQRGREIMQAFIAGYPKIILLLTYGYFLALQGHQSLSTVSYGLLPAFLDGLLEGSTPETLLFDGWENAYGYTQERQFREARDIMRQGGLGWTSVKEHYRQHYRASFGLWVDYKGAWNTSDFTQNYFTPDTFEQAVRLALLHSDRYVWIYSQKARWWDGTMPQPYIEALRKARTPRSPR